MKPNTPILMLSLLIPVTPDTNPDQVINIIGQQVIEAMNQIRSHREEADQDTADPESIPQNEFNSTLLDAKLESYSDPTKADLLSALGYNATE